MITVRGGIGTGPLRPGWWLLAAGHERLTQTRGRSLPELAGACHQNGIPRPQLLPQQVAVVQSTPGCRPSRTGGSASNTRRSIRLGPPMSAITLFGAARSSRAPGHRHQPAPRRQGLLLQVRSVHRWARCCSET